MVQACVLYLLHDLYLKRGVDPYLCACTTWIGVFLLSMYSGFSYFGWTGRWSPQYGIFDAYNDPSGKPCSKRFFVPLNLRNFVKEV